jgi:hypothetical protein
LNSPSGGMNEMTPLSIHRLYLSCTIHEPRIGQMGRSQAGLPDAWVKPTIIDKFWICKRQ